MSEKDKNGILSTIFPQRSITGAKALLDAIESGDWTQLYKAISTSAGAAQNASDIMMDTQQGDLAILEAQYEKLKLMVGEELTEDIRTFAGSIGDFLNSVTNMDPAMFSAMVSGLETIAKLGAGLGVTGTALKLMSGLGVWGGIGAAAIAVGALGVAIGTYNSEMEKAQYAGLFGDMSIDTTAISTYAATIGADF